MKLLLKLAMLAMLLVPVTITPATATPIQANITVTWYGENMCGMFDNLCNLQSEVPSLAECNENPVGWLSGALQELIATLGQYFFGIVATCG
jgi:hypothetical protein